MAAYGSIEIAVMMDKGDIKKAENKANSYNIKNVELVIETTDGRIIEFDSKKRTINDINIEWETEFDDEAC